MAFQLVHLGSTRSYVPKTRLMHPAWGEYKLAVLLTEDADGKGPDQAINLDVKEDAKMAPAQEKKWKYPSAKRESNHS